MIDKPELNKLKRFQTSVGFQAKSGRDDLTSEALYFHDLEQNKVVAEVHGAKEILYILDATNKLQQKTQRFVFGRHSCEIDLPTARFLGEPVVIELEKN